MSKQQLFVKVNLHEGRYGYEPAKQSEIDEAAGIVDLRQQRDSLLTIAKKAHTFLTDPDGDDYYFYENCALIAKELSDTIDACEPEVKCPICKGAGRVEFRDDDDAHGPVLCKPCNGTGLVPACEPKEGC